MRKAKSRPWSQGKKNKKYNELILFQKLAYDWTKRVHLNQEGIMAFDTI